MGIHSMGAASPTTTQTKARTLLRAAARALPITTATTLATVTQGAANANSTIVTTATTGAPSIGWNDARLTDLCGVWTNDPDNVGYGYIASHVTNKAAASKRNNVGAGKMFGFDGQAFDVCTFNGPVRLCATDLTTGLRQWYSADVAVSGSFVYTKFDFGSRAPRIVEVYFGPGSSFWGRGFNVAATDTIWQASKPDAPLICGFGDSYTAGTNNDTIKSKYLDILGERLGANVIMSAVAGSGYTVAGGGGYTWPQRIANGDLDVSRIGDLDLLFVFGSVNDNSSADAGVQAAVTASVQAMMAVQPNAIIMVAGPQLTAAVQTSTSRYAAVQAGVVAAAAGASRVVYIDNSPAGEKWQTGTGKVGATTGNGNNDLYMENAGTHWTADGNRYGGRRIADSILSKLAALA